MAESYKNLKVWKEAKDLAIFVYRITKKFPKDEMFGITSQLRRAVVSIPSNIAEGSSRGSRKDYSRFVEIATGSLNEVENLVGISSELGYINKIESETFTEKIITIGNLLGGFKKFLNK